VVNRRGSVQHTTSSQNCAFKEIDQVARPLELARILQPGPMTAGSVVFQGKQPALARMQSLIPSALVTTHAWPRLHPLDICVKERHDMSSPFIQLESGGCGVHARYLIRRAPNSGGTTPWLRLHIIQTRRYILKLYASTYI
jgi:hypothetical protein